MHRAGRDRCEETRGGETKIWSIETAARARAHALPSLAFGWYVARVTTAISVSLWSTGHRWSNRVLSALSVIGWKSFPIPRKIFEIICLPYLDLVSSSSSFHLDFSLIQFIFRFIFRFNIAFALLLILIYLFVRLFVFLRIFTIKLLIYKKIIIISKANNLI